MRPEEVLAFPYDEYAGDSVFVALVGDETREGVSAGGRRVEWLSSVEST
jgi:hypothetical protein